MSAVVARPTRAAKRYPLGRVPLVSSNQSAEQSDDDARDRAFARLWEHLENSLDDLKASARIFDAGREAEARRMAVTLRMLVEDRGKQRSILGQLDTKYKLAYFDSAEDINPENLLPTLGLVILRASQEGSEYAAPLDDLPPFRVHNRVKFKTWWNRPVLKDSKGERWSRSDYVHALADQEGGAHVDPVPQPRYEALARDNSLGWTFSSANASVEPVRGNAVAVSVRQITHELLKTCAAPAYVYTGARGS